MIQLFLFFEEDEFLSISIKESFVNLAKHFVTSRLKFVNASRRELSTSWSCCSVPVSISEVSSVSKDAPLAMMDVFSNLFHHHVPPSLPDFATPSMMSSSLDAACGFSVAGAVATIISTMATQVVRIPRRMDDEVVIFVIYVSDNFSLFFVKEKTTT